MAESELKVGDVVRVRHNIAELPDPYGVGFVLFKMREAAGKVMREAAGKVARVTSIDSPYSVGLAFLDIDRAGRFEQWNWATNWLEPLGASAPELTKEESTLSIQTDLININLSDNKEYLMRKGIIVGDGRLSDSATFLQWMLAENEDAFVKALKDAEAKRLTREEAVKAAEAPAQ
jgi:hypothetical protein